MVNEQLLSRDGEYKAPPVPFSVNSLIRDFNPLYFKVYDKVKAVEIWISFFQKST